MMLIKKHPFFSLCSVFGVALLFCMQIAYGEFYEGHAEGWHWYKTLIEGERQDKDNGEETLHSDPVKEMKVLKATIEHALDKAILYPTDANVKDYIALQNRIGNQSSMFANVWQKVLLENPNLNYSLVHPTNNLAKQVDYDIEHKKEEAAIAKLAQESGLFFFYSGSCAYCRKFAPILKDFASSYHISVVPITLDGGFLPEFPDSKIDKGQAAKFKVTVEPSLYAVNPYTGKAYPVSQGLISQADLRARILDISQNFMGGS